VIHLKWKTVQLQNILKVKHFTERTRREQKEECKQHKSKTGDGSRQTREGSNSVAFPKICHLAGACPRMFCLQPMTESHKRGVEHMPLQLEHSMREEDERERERIHIAK